MSSKVTERDVKTLADVLFSLMQTSWTTTTLARDLLTSDWLADRAAEAREDAARQIETMRPDVSLEAHPTGDESLAPDIARRRALNDAARVVRATSPTLPALETE